MKTLVLAYDRQWLHQWLKSNGYSVKRYQYVHDEDQLAGLPRETRVICLVWDTYVFPRFFTELEMYGRMVRIGEEYFLDKFTEPVSIINNLEPDPHAQPQ